MYNISTSVWTRNIEQHVQAQRYYLWQQAQQPHCILCHLVLKPHFNLSRVTSIIWLGVQVNIKSLRQDKIVL